MKKIFWIVALFVLLGISVIPADAQWGPATTLTAAITGQDCRYTTQCDGYGGGYRRPYPTRRGGFNDPYLVDPRLFDLQELPPLELQDCIDPECMGLEGTYHAEGGLIHFRPYDSTHNPFNVNHKNCLVIHSRTQSQQLTQSAVEYVEYNDQPVSYVEPESESKQLTARGVDPLANLTWLTVNTTSFRAVVTDPNTGEVKLIPAGGSMNLSSPTGDQPYVVVLLAPGRGSVDKVPGEIRPSDDFQGWDIVAQ